MSKREILTDTIKKIMEVARIKPVYFTFFVKPALENLRDFEVDEVERIIQENYREVKK